MSKQIGNVKITWVDSSGKTVCRVDFFQAVVENEETLKKIRPVLQAGLSSEIGFPCNIDFVDFQDYRDS